MLNTNLEGFDNLSKLQKETPFYVARDWLYKKRQKEEQELSGVDRIIW